MEAMTKQKAQALVDSHPWWYHKYEIFPGIVTPGVYDPSGTLRELGLADDLKGQRILEIGPADGYFTKELTRRGASVVAVDYAAKDHYGFGKMELLSGRTFDFRQCNLYDLPDLKLGNFDLVICLGVFYHLPDICRGLYILRELTKSDLILETFISRKHEELAMAEYLVADSQNNDDSNFWAPNARCIEAMMIDVGFDLKDTWLNETRGMFKAKAVDRPRKLPLAYGFRN